MAESQSPTTPIETPPEETNETNGLPKPLTLTITFNPNGSVGVHGPIADKAICYSMLEMARDAIFEMHLKKSMKEPIIHRGGILGFARNRNR